MITSSLCWLKDECNRCDCDGFCLRLYKLNYLYEQAGISLQQRAQIPLWSNSEKEFNDEEAFTKLADISNNIEEFIANGNNLYIHSIRCGNGKTSWSLRMIQSYFNKIWYSSELKCKALFIHVPSLLIALKDNIDTKSDFVQHIKENIFTADIVIWDDIATKQTTVFESENLLSMIDTRINLGKSNIYTSNLSDVDLRKALGDRLASRICNLSENIELRGKDKRGVKEE